MNDYAVVLCVCVWSRPNNLIAMTKILTFWMYSGSERTSGGEHTHIETWATFSYDYFLMHDGDVINTVIAPRHDTNQPRTA